MLRNIHYYKKEMSSVKVTLYEYINLNRTMAGENSVVSPLGHYRSIYKMIGSFARPSGSTCPRLVWSPTSMVSFLQGTAILITWEWIMFVFCKPKQYRPSKSVCKHFCAWLIYYLIFSNIRYSQVPIFEVESDFVKFKSTHLFKTKTQNFNLLCRI